MPKHLREIILHLYRDEAGLQIVEYVLLMVVISIGAIAGMALLGSGTSNRMNNISDAVG